MVCEGGMDTCSVGEGGIGDLANYLTHNEVVGVRGVRSEESEEALRGDVTLIHGEGKGDITRIGRRIFYYPDFRGCA